MLLLQYDKQRLFSVAEENLCNKAETYFRGELAIPTIPYGEQTTYVQSVIPSIRTTERGESEVL